MGIGPAQIIELYDNGSDDDDNNIKVEPLVGPSAVMDNDDNSSDKEDSSVNKSDNENLVVKDVLEGDKDSEISKAVPPLGVHRIILHRGLQNRGNPKDEYTPSLKGNIMLHGG